MKTGLSRQSQTLFAALADLASRATIQKTEVFPSSCNDSADGSRKSWASWRILFFLPWIGACQDTTTLNLRDSTLPAIQGPLQVHPLNPAYFSDEKGSPVYLRGSHNWNNLQDWGSQQFNYDAYLDFLVDHNHNFTRLWIIEEFAAIAPNGSLDRILPTPYLAVDHSPGKGDPVRFDLNQVNPEFLYRLRERVYKAQQRGIYVAVMLFNGWSIEEKTVGRQPHLNSWLWHPFHVNNNINGIDPDTNGDGQGRELHTLEIVEANKLQFQYVSAIVEALNDLDNVLWEISNESHSDSTQWQYAMIDHIRSHEAKLDKQHLVGMSITYPDGSNDTLWHSSADWVSPNSDADSQDFRNNPPSRRGNKIVINDTDHLWGIGGNQGWVWKSFTRALHPVFMDPYETTEADPTLNLADHPTRANWPSIRRNLGYTGYFAGRLRLESVRSCEKQASSTYCLSDDARAFLVFLPDESGFDWWFDKKSVTLELERSAENFSVEWFDPSTGSRYFADPVDGGGSRTFRSPFPGDAVLFLQPNE